MAKTTNNTAAELGSEAASENLTYPEHTRPDAPTASVSELAATLIEESPEPQPHAIEQAAAERQAASEDSKDAEGTIFDPSQHSGTKTASGAWRKKSGRKPGGQANAPRSRLNLPNANSGTTASSAQSPDSKIASSRATGKMAANLFLMLSCGIGGQEWMPRTVPMDEKAMLEEGFADYFQSKEWEDMPPGIALVACLGMYAMPRFAMPKTQERAKGFKNWIAGKYINWKAARAKKRYMRDNASDPNIVRAEKAARRSYAEERESAAREEARAKVGS